MEELYLYKLTSTVCLCPVMYICGRKKSNENLPSECPETAHPLTPVCLEVTHLGPPPQCPFNRTLPAQKQHTTVLQTALHKAAQLTKLKRWRCSQYRWYNNLMCCFLWNELVFSVCKNQTQKNHNDVQWITSTVSVPVWTSPLSFKYETRTLFFSVLVHFYGYSSQIQTHTVIPQGPGIPQGVFSDVYTQPPDC